MLEYPKVESLFRRDEKTGKVNGEIRRREFDLVTHWVVSEKIHGQNVRIQWDNDNERVIYGSRKQVGPDSLPKDLIAFLDSKFTVEKMKEAFGNNPVVLFGEGYGPGINGGGNLAKQKQFALFDVWMKEKFWLEPDQLEGFGEFFGIETAPVLKGLLTLQEIIPMVRKGFNSTVALKNTGETVIAEGVVCRTYPQMFMKDGSRLQFKLKTEDFATNVIQLPQKKGIIQVEGHLAPVG